MSWIQQLEEEQYDNQTEWLDVMRAESVDHFADDVAWYCETHDFEAYNQDCPQCAEERELAADDYLPDLQTESGPPF